MRLPVEGALVALTSAGTDVWALIDTCPIGAVSCPQNIAERCPVPRHFGAHSEVAAGCGALPAGYGVFYPAARQSIIVAFGNLHYSRAVGKASGASSVTSCAVAGPLEGKLPVFAMSAVAEMPRSAISPFPITAAPPGVHSSTGHRRPVGWGHARPMGLTPSSMSLAARPSGAQVYRRHGGKQSSRLRRALPTRSFRST